MLFERNEMQIQIDYQTIKACACAIMIAATANLAFSQDATDTDSIPPDTAVDEVDVKVENADDLAAAIDQQLIDAKIAYKNIQSEVEFREAIRPDGEIGTAIKLIERFRSEYPDHPRANEFANERWKMKIKVINSKDATLKELLVVKRDPDADPKLVNHAEFWYTDMLITKLSSNKKTVVPERILSFAHEFIEQYPDDPRGSDMLLLVSRMFKPKSEDRLDIYREMKANYPETFSGRIAAGHLRQIEEQGKPFELEFENALTGEMVSIEDYKGKIIILDFWSSWCKPCVQEIELYNTIQEEYKDLGLVVIGISLDVSEEQGGRDAMMKVINERELEWPQFYTGNYFFNDFTISWGIEKIPYVFIINQEGLLVTTSGRGRAEEVVRNLLGLPPKPKITNTQPGINLNVKTQENSGDDK